MTFGIQPTGDMKSVTNAGDSGLAELRLGT